MRYRWGSFHMNQILWTYGVVQIFYETINIILEPIRKPALPAKASEKGIAQAPEGGILTNTAD